jgi:hypothetical protein
MTRFKEKKAIENCNRYSERVRRGLLTPGEIASQGLGNFSAEMVRGVEVTEKIVASTSCSAT